MSVNKILVGLCVSLFSVSAQADLEPFKDYTIGESVTNMTTVKVDSNMGDAYLEGLRATWVASNEVAKKLGHIEDYAIYRSQLPASGDFNLVLLVTYKSAADMGPSEERYKAFMKEWGDREETTKPIVANYPSMREITGDYNLRKITIK